MIPYKYTYLVGNLLLLPVWILVYWRRKDLRKEMLYMSLAVMILGVYAEYYIWTADWWQPLTITGTKIGIEDFLLGFTNGGVAAVIYEVIFKKRLYKRQTYGHTHGIWIVAMYTYAVISAGLHYLHFTSFYATIFGFGVGGLIMILYRRDLLFDAIASGILIALGSWPFYWLLAKLSPGFIQAFWYSNRLSGILFFGVPIEDIIFYFFVGFFVGPLYEFWQSQRLVKLRQ